MSTPSSQRPRRILITGVSNFWGTELATRLEADPQIEQIVAVDSDEPAGQLVRTDFVRADIRHSLIGRLIRTLDIDTVVHAGLVVESGSTSRSAHEANVIGTMNLLAACGGADSPVRKLVVKASTAIYGSEAADPSFWVESMKRKASPRDSLTRDLDEVERYVHEFSLRRPEATVTVLRCAGLIGPNHQTEFTRYFDLAVTPTIFGFDPRMQFLHEDDVVVALKHAVQEDHPGTFNLAGDGIVLLSQAIKMMGHVSAPVLPFIGTGTAVSALKKVGVSRISPQLARFLKYGRVVDTSLFKREFGWCPAFTTVEAIEDYAKQRRVRGLSTDGRSYRHEGELEAFLRGKAAVKA